MPEDPLGALADRTVVVTRASHQAGPLAAALRTHGARPVIAPAIAVVPPLDGGQPLDDALLRLEQFSWVAFTSSNAVAATFARADRRGVRRRFARIRTAAVGPSTAARVEAEIGRPVNLVPEQSDAAGLAEAFPDPRADDWCFVPQSAQARPELADGLRARGWNVDAVSAYRIVTPTLSDHLIADMSGADAVVFASPSAVRGHLSQMGSQGVTGKIVCIGRTTAAACQQADVPVAAVADGPTDAGLVDAVATALRADDRPAGS
ncbi:MAG: uroporphyrinogen-III synthase [Acidimicrobiales bacterium]|nr:uroporphyrinogen-III synthase [Acidimicrobiaceae bacterium]MYA24984.1 uroporphyrinogen-III synthase [Acidimicrobiales bacterium]MYD83958.1 uroporphyrinogen-III synthase [Acidimicrobiales bacterium]MYJ65062.1 uroporphyrinogen-III synthase [Acidimicrobiales bacterium]